MIRLALLSYLAEKKGKFPNTSRWFQDYDAAAHVLRNRYAKALLVNVAIMCLNATPYKHTVDFADNLSAVFAKEHGQSLQTASHLLSDGLMWQVLVLLKMLLRM